MKNKEQGIVLSLGFITRMNSCRYQDCSSIQAQEEKEKETGDSIQQQRKAAIPISDNKYI
jgi:hypothetical protein